MPRTSNSREKVNVYVGVDVIEALRRLAAKQGRPQSELIRDALRAYVISEAAKIAQEQRTIREAGK